MFEMFLSHISDYDELAQIMQGTDESNHLRNPSELHEGALHF